MRTKALVLAAAVGALGVATCMAVNSVNVVGYINKTCNPGYNLIANQLKVGGNTLDEIIPPASIPDSTTILFWDSSIADFKAVTVLGGVWYHDDLSGAGGDLVIPGTPFFVNNLSGAPFTMTFVGDVPQTPDPYFTKTLAASGYTMTASSAPVSKPIDDPVYNFPTGAEIESLTLLKFNNSINDYKAWTVIGGTWYDADLTPGAPTIDVGEGFFVNELQGLTLTWTMTFTVN